MQAYHCRECSEQACYCKEFTEQAENLQSKHVIAEQACYCRKFTEQACHCREFKEQACHCKDSRELFNMQDADIFAQRLPMRRVWRIGRVDAFRPKGHGFDSSSSRHVGTLGKSFTHSCLWRFGVKFRHSVGAVGSASE